MSSAGGVALGLRSGQQHRVAARRRRDVERGIEIAEQAVEDERGEVLIRDRDLVVLPQRADVVHRRGEHVVEHGHRRDVARRALHHLACPVEVARVEREDERRAPPVLLGELGAPRGKS